MIKEWQRDLDGCNWSVRYLVIMWCFECFGKMCTGDLHISSSKPLIPNMCWHCWPSPYHGSGTCTFYISFVFLWISRVHNRKTTQLDHSGKPLRKTTLKDHSERPLRDHSKRLLRTLEKTQRDCPSHRCSNKNSQRKLNWCHFCLFGCFQLQFVQPVWSAPFPHLFNTEQQCFEIS